MQSNRDSQFQELARTIMGDGTRVRTLKQGVSGTQVVVVVQNGTDCIIKVGKRGLRNTIADEVRNGNLLRQFMPEHIPKVIKQGVTKGTDGQELEYMVMPHVGNANLHEVVMRGLLPNAVIVEIKRDILRTKQGMWLQSRKAFLASECRRDYPTRDAELRDRILALKIDDGTLGQYVDLPLIINGFEYPPITHVIEKLQIYYPPIYSVISHGDGNADNYVINTENHRWYLIDWEWAGRHDWRESVARMLGWWQTNTPRLEQEAQISVDTDAIRINYDLHVPLLTRELIGLVKDLASRMGILMEQKDWEDMVRKFIASYCFRDLQFQPLRERAEYRWPVFSEAIKALHTPLE